jgi:hypothetical protein
VYVNGYLAGVADDFDGVFQRLRLQAGEYEIVCYLPGHQSWGQRLLALPGRDYRLRHDMIPLAPGELDDPRPDAASWPYPTYPPGIGEVDDESFGTLSIRVQPTDAAVVIDGEVWQPSDQASAVIVQLAEGSHDVEASKAGYRTFSAEVIVRRGETTHLNISLSATER